MINKVWAYMQKYHMVEEGDRIVAGISGGADSVCLFHVLNKLCKDYGATFLVVHVNHGIRGEEADRDESFVARLCEKEGISFYPFHFNVKEYAEAEGLSEEEAGRDLRYQSFLEICKSNKCNKIAIAHNKNDNAETVLFHLFRGSGIRGLSGIEPSRRIDTDFGEVTLIRPLLCLERKEIEEYLESNHLEYLTDSTNLTEDYSRNKVRHRVLNYAEAEINVGAVGNIVGAAAQLKEIEEYLSYNIESRYPVLVTIEDTIFRFCVADFQKEAVVIQKGILRKLLEQLGGSQKDLEAKHIDAILELCNKQVGRYIHLPYGILAERDYQDIIIFRGEEDHSLRDTSNQMEPILLPIPGKVYIPQIRKFLETKLINYKKTETIPKSSCIKWFDYDKIENAVEIRTRNEGDYIQINGFGGRKKIKDYFIDHKIPQKLRNEQILITDGSHVMWIPGVGERISEKYKVDGTTIKVLLMKMTEPEDNQNET